MSYKTFVFPADVIDGEIQESFVDFTFRCDKVQIIGPIIYRDYDAGVDKIIAKKVFVIKYGEQLFGSTQFSSRQEYEMYVEGYCQCCPCTHCYILINGCYVEVNGCYAEACGCSLYIPLINGCGIEINGCQVTLN